MIKFLKNKSRGQESIAVDTMQHLFCVNNSSAHLDTFWSKMIFFQRM